MRFEILEPGDKVLNITKDFVAVERLNGEVEVFPIVVHDGRMSVGKDSILTITFAGGTVQTETIEGVTFTTFYS